LSATFIRWGSLNVFKRQSWPPQRAAFGAAEWRPAAVAATTPAARKIRAKAATRIIFLAVVIVRFFAPKVYSGDAAGVAELANALGLGPSGA
jgi:hypothetical protein